MRDRRGLESWPARIAAAENMVNDYRHGSIAIATLVAALDYGTDPLVFKVYGTYVRRLAALGLGRLKAERRDQAVVTRLESLLRDELDPQVLDGAFKAIHSLIAAPEMD
jgi:hypothetical protein